MSSTEVPVPVPQVPINEQDLPLFKSINAFVHGYMSQPGFDNSHDYHHILRVLSNAHILLQAQQAANPSIQYDTLAVYLAALLHDVGDHKYVKPSEDPKTMISSILLSHGASTSLALRVQDIVNNVGFTIESKHPQSVIEALENHPELAIVQDADRLDSIGAVGVARLFAFGAAKRPDETLEMRMEHLHVKLYRLVEMMKTDAGREMAMSRTQVLKGFEDQFIEETKLSFAVK